MAPHTIDRSSEMYLVQEALARERAQGLRVEARQAHVARAVLVARRLDRRARLADRRARAARATLASLPLD